MTKLFPPAKERMANILTALKQAYPHATCTLNFSNPLELLIATILSAQCMDALVNTVTPKLFQKYRSAESYAKASIAILEKDISRVNFYRNKARSIQESCRTIVERFGGKIPCRMEDLLQLRGVARKTANVVLGNAFGIQEGIVVDTHVMRLSQRLHLSTHQDREKIERDLMALVPQSDWSRFGHQMILHGRTVCRAKRPLCSHCRIGQELCPSFKL